MMTDVGGASVWNLEVRPFGDSENVTGTATLNLRFPGQYYDDESGLNQNWNRDYFPELGRYIQPDPLGLLRAMKLLHAKRRGLKGTINLYGYADENPIRYTDRLGLIAGGIGGGVGGIITPPPPGMGIGGEALCYIVIDSKGNIGLLCCAAAGPFFGAAATAGAQAGGTLCFTCETICDLPGFFVQAMGTGAAKVGAMAGGGVSFGSGGLGASANVGPAAGGGGAAGVVVGGCELVLGGGGCKESCEEQ